MSHFSATNLFTKLKKSTGEQTALTITKALKDLLALELKLENKISFAKWQVIGVVAVMLFAEVALRHFGI